MKIVTVGDNCMDVYEQTGKAYPGGNPVNVAVYLRRLNHAVDYVGVVGTDHYGSLMLDALSEKGIGISHVHQIPGETARSSVELHDGDRVFGDYFEGVMASFSLSEEDIQFICSHELMHTAYWGETDHFLPRLKEGGVLICYDFADKLDDPKVEKLLPYVDYPLFSYKQDDEYIRSYLKNAHVTGAKLSIATLGRNGSLVYDGKTFYTYGIEDTAVVDTMGAGDSYIAGFLAGIAEGKTVEECMRMGTHSSAVTLGYSGAW